MGEKKLSLMIYGTRLSTSGWEPLIMLNNPPFPELKNIGMAGVGENPTYLTFRIDQNYTQYTLVYNPKYIKAHAAQRDGALKISIAIPKGYKLDGNVSPYDVFKAIQRTLEFHAFNPIVGKPGAFEFKETFPTADVFNQVLDSFRLIETKMPHRPMSSVSNEVGLIIVAENSEVNLLQDIQYPEFSSYKEIVVARSGESDNIIKNLEIPRKPKYEIIINNKNATSRIRNYNYGYDDPITIDTVRFWGYDVRVYIGERLDFTINDALKGKYRHLMYVDRERECIEVTINKPRVREETRKIVLDGVDKFSVYNHLTAYVNGNPRQISSSNTIVLRGEEILGATIDIKADGKDYRNNGKISLDGNKIIVPIMEIPKPRKDEKLRREYTNSMTRHFENETIGNKIIKFQLILEDPKDINDCNKPCRVRFYREGISFTFNRPFNKRNGGKGYYIDVAIPSAWAGEYAIDLRTDCVKIPLKNRRLHLIGTDTHEIKISKNDTDALTWRDKMNKSTRSILRALVFLIIMATVSYCSIWAYNRYIHNDDSAIITKSDTEEDSDKEADSIAKKITQFQSQLRKEAITFDQIQEMKSWISEDSHELNADNGGDKFKTKIDAYMDLISVIEKPNKRSTDKIKQTANKNKDQIEPTHWVLIQQVWRTNNSDGKPRDILDKERSKIDKRLKENERYKSFRDLPSAYDILNSGADGGAGSGSGNKGDGGSGETEAAEDSNPRW